MSDFLPLQGQNISCGNQVIRSSFGIKYFTVNNEATSYEGMLYVCMYMYTSVLANAQKHGALSLYSFSALFFRQCCLFSNFVPVEFSMCVGAIINHPVRKMQLLLQRFLYDC